MRVMVGVIILYDHVHPVGAFAKTSKIDVRHTLIFLFFELQIHYGFVSTIINSLIQLLEKIVESRSLKCFSVGETNKGSMWNPRSKDFSFREGSR